MPHDDPPSHVPANTHKVEKDGRLYLPVAHDLFPEPRGRAAGVINKIWLILQGILRGLYATAAEWGISFMDLALEYPKVALGMVLSVGVVAEETIADKPVLMGSYHYALVSMNPEAAALVFPPEVDPSEADVAVDKLAAGIVQNASDDYYQSAEYILLQEDIQASMHRQVVEMSYEKVGLPAPPPKPKPVEKKPAAKVKVVAAPSVPIPEAKEEEPEFVGPPAPLDLEDFPPEEFNPAEDELPEFEEP
jgi:hypothetical protein